MHCKNFTVNGTLRGKLCGNEYGITIEKIDTLSASYSYSFVSVQCEKEMRRQFMVIYEQCIGTAVCTFK